MAHTLTDDDPGTVGSPWYWPAHPFASVFQRSDHVGRFPQGWLVHGLPPTPWPLVNTYPAANFGPADTTYQFQGSAYNDRLDDVQGDLTDEELAEICFSNDAPIPNQPENRALAWNVPGSDPGMTINALRATIHAKVGSVEESVNVLHYITNPETAITPEIVATFGDKVATQWTAFLASNNGGIAGGVGHTVKNFYSSQVLFDEVRAAHVELVGSGDTKHAQWVGDTYFAPFGDDGIQCVGAPLPPQIAAVVSLGTSARGQSKRGRTYLGPLGQLLMGSDGMFDPGLMQDVMNAWTDTMGVAMLDGDDSFRLVVLSGRTDARYLVTQIRAGIVPDTQRRRRKSYPETYGVTNPLG